MAAKTPAYTASSAIGAIGVAGLVNPNVSATFTASGTTAGISGGVLVPSGAGGGTISSAFGVKASVGILTGGAGTITNAYGLNFTPYAQSGTIGTMYDLRLVQTVGTEGNIGTHYGVYQENAAAKNYFAGNVGIGTTTPQEALQIGNAWTFRDGPATGKFISFNGYWNGSSWTYLTTNPMVNMDLGIDGSFSVGTAPSAAAGATTSTPSQKFLVTNTGNVGIGTTVPNTALDINGALSQRGMAAPAVSPGGQGRIYFDSGSNQFMVSQNGAGYVAMGLAGSGVVTFNGRAGAVLPAANDYSFAQISGSVAGTQLPALTGDTTMSAGTTVTTTSKVNGVSYPVTPATNTVPVVTSANTVTYETVPIAAGGTGATTKAAAFDALSPMSTLGDITYGGAAGTGTRLAGNTTAVKQFLTQTGTGAVSAAPAWGALAAGDVPNPAGDVTGTYAATVVSKINGTAVSGVGLANGNVLQNNSGGALTANNLLVTNGTATGVTNLSSPASGVLTSSANVPSWSAALPISLGGTNIGTYATGDILYASAANTLSKLSIGGAGNVLTVSGGIPSWAAPAGASALSAITAATGANSINNGVNAQTWNWQLTGNTVAMNIAENAASTGGTGTQDLFKVSTLAASTANPFHVMARGTEAIMVDNTGKVGIGTASPGYALDVTGFVNTDQNSGYKQAGNTILSTSTVNFATLVGVGAGPSIPAGATYNTAVGYQALNQTNAGNFSTAVGAKAGYSSSGGYNTLIGFQAGYSTTGNNSTAVGYQALELFTGNNSVAIGNAALAAAGSGINNVAIGYQAMNNTAGTGASNLAVGYRAGMNLNNGSTNVAIGASAGYDLTDGGNNTFVGNAAGRPIATGSGNIVIGYNPQAGLVAGTANTLNIGNLIFGTGLTTGATLSSGSVGIGITAPNTVLDINGAFSQRGMAAPAVSPGGQGRIYFDSGSNQFMVSQNGGAYAALGIAGSGVVTFNGRAGAVSPAANDYSFAQISGSVAGTQLPALTGDTTMTAGTTVTTTSKVNGVSYPTGPATNTVPVVTSANTITYETVPIAAGGTGATTKAAAFDALSPMSTLGDITYGGAAGTGTRLAGNTTAAKQFLTQTGTGAVSAAPAWGALAAGDVPNPAGDVTGTYAATVVSKINGTAVSGVGLANGNVLQNNSGGALTGNNLLVTNGTATGVTNIASPANGVLTSSANVPSWSATLPIALGGTNIGTYATGDILYASAANTLSKLSIGGAGNVLTVSGGIPSWAAPAGASALSAITAATGANSINNGVNAQTWNWHLTGNTVAMNITENAASSGGTGTQDLFKISTLATSTANPFHVVARGIDAIMVDNTGEVGIGTTNPASKLHVGVAATGTANYGLISAGGAPFDGVTAGFFVGSNAHGTDIAVNEAGGYLGDFINFELAGVSAFKVDYTGKITGNGTNVTNVTAVALNGNINSYTETSQTVSNSGAFTLGAYTSGNAYAVTITGDSTITLPTPSATANTATEITVAIIQDATGGWNLAFSPSVGSLNWPGGNVPTQCTAATQTTIYQFIYLKATNKWYGSLIWKDCQ